MIELRWTHRSLRPENERPAAGWIPIGQPPQMVWQVLQYRTIKNPLEIELHEPIWTDWFDVPFGWNQKKKEKENLSA